MNILVTGGAGFIGCNIVKRHLEKKDKVVVLDNLSRIGTEKNLYWLKDIGKFSFIKGDIRNKELIEKIFRNNCFDLVYHMAAQVAVTTSVINPREDFEINALGSLNLLESIRKTQSKSVLIFASTNKVYGALEDVKLKELDTRYEFKSGVKSIAENTTLDFHSPYGCSKGAADQYIRDYSRIYGLKTIVFRQSCIYGKRQFGVEDQGWVAYFIIRSIFDKPITIYGTGKQVRDVLYIDDLLDAYELAYKRIERTSGQIYNIGGGEKNAISLLELIKLLEKKLDKKIRYKFDSWRPGDQKIFISNNTKLKRDLGWSPRIGISEGIDLLIDWVKSNKRLFRIT